MKKIFVSAVFLLFVASIIWIMVSKKENHVAASTVSKNPPSTAEPEAAVQNEAPEKTIKEDEMTAFEERIGRKFTAEEKRLKPPEMSWTAWGQYVDVHRTQSLKNGNVTFYGKVITPDGTPLPGVSLTAEIREYIDSIAKKLIKGNSTSVRQIPLITDAEGRFSIIGEDGTNLHVTDITKDGYEVVDKEFWGGSFNPHVAHRHKPDPENPEIFTMKKVE
ncbi:MAG: hypothetical protein MI807_20100 [Verrucomicrobiales bacterium]|nr:hypothetical protein [Verrucomicrobiales bacterium]